MPDNRIFKYKDNTDGNYAYVIATNQGEAIQAIKKHTSLDIECVKVISIDELERPFIIRNKILPF